MKILHITPWLPNKLNPKEALWIERHIKSLDGASENIIWHVGVNIGKFSRLKYKEKNRIHNVVSVPTNRWVIIELLVFFQLFFLGLFNKKLIRSVDVINFHIAYPSLVYWNVLKKFFNRPTIITEHWSAYHFKFGVKKELPRIKKIFSHQIPVIAVSDALLNDIKVFSQNEFPSIVIPNIVDDSIFFNDSNIDYQPERFFMVSQWKSPKDPFTIINQFKEYLIINPKARLVIGGYGPQEKNILELISKERLSDNIDYLGKLSSAEIAYQMNKAMVFIHLSDYETFSVVCAEAVCCGCPVIASNVGGIIDFIDDSNGKLVNNSSLLFENILNTDFSKFNRSTISNLSLNRFSPKTIGDKYFNFLNKIINNQIDLLDDKG